MAKTTVHGGPSNADDPEQVTDPEQAEQVDEPDGGGEEEVADQAVNYESWTVSQLQVELAERGLSSTGKKAELQQRLVDDDTQNQPDPEIG